MPSKSEKQRKFKGDSKVSGAAKKTAKKMPMKEIKKFLKKKPASRKKAASSSKSKKGKKKITECATSLFIDCIFEQNYDEASKYLTSILNSKLQARIENELATPLF